MPTFLSHAPNSEDVPLWRALSDITAGRYVDWASEPADGASVTRAFYDRGWSGLSVRPSAAEAAALAARRPRDVVVTAGEVPLVEGPLHFLRIDAPKQQAAVLRAFILPDLRPWIVVVRAEAPDDGWLAQEGYQFALFDGLNHFYLAAEHADRAGRLAAPANVSDRYLRAADATAGARVAALESTLSATEARADGARSRLLDAVRAAGQARSDIGVMAGESAWLRGLLDEARDAEAKLRAHAAWLHDQLVTAREERSGALLARTEEAAWLRQCLADSEARVAAAQAALADAHGQIAHVAKQATVSYQITRPLRRLRRAVLPAASPTAPQAATPAAAPNLPATDSSETDLSATEPSLPPDIAAPPPPLPIASAEPEPAAAPATEPHRRIAHSVMPVCTVHQFHAGSAPGDAITNAMLLIRGRLRADGFRSDIFVATRGSGLEDNGIALLDQLPAHGDYVLLLHHSMGFPAFDAIMALPARKVLIYHNITPPEMLRNVPRIERSAQLGRQQLAAMRGHVAAALAISDYNAIELHTLGFPAVATCPLLFDVAAIRQRAAGPRPADGVFTVLFVGRITPSKSQDDLITAFAAFRRRFGQPCRLVLVGALNPDEHHYLDTLHARIAAHALEDDVQLTGLVSDAELHGWYRQADLYVSLSRHEGFGVPLIEALAHGIAVLAWPTGAVPYTVCDAGRLLTTREPEGVAEAMLAMAVDAGADGRAGQASVDRFALDRHWPTLLRALASAGAMPPASAASHAAWASNLRVTVAGHVAKTYSLAAINRSIARTIETLRPGAVRLLPVEGQPTSDLAEVPADERAFVARLAARPRFDTGPELVLSGHYPVYVPAERGDLLAALFFWEESLIPAGTVATLNTEFDAVFAPSRFVAKALVDSGVAIPVLNIGYAPDLQAHTALGDARAERSGPLTFLHVSSAFPRKGLDVLLAAWARAFTAADPVRLVIKTFPNPHNEATTQVAAMRDASADAAPVVLIDEDLPADAMLALYRDADAAVLPTRGEGFNLPAAEAMAAGLPLIVTGFGGHLDFCDRTTARLIRRRFAASRSHIAPPHSLWAEPDVDDLAAALREVLAGVSATQITAARRQIIDTTEPAAFIHRLASAATSVLLTTRHAVRLAWISTWNVRCGIAEYSRNLVEALPRDGLAAITILADDRTPAAVDAECQVESAWQAGDEPPPQRLVAAIDRADADIVVLQHQPGLIAWPALAWLLDRLADDGRAVLVTLHNTRDLLQQSGAVQAAVVRSMRRTARVLVHTAADLAMLDDMGLIDQVTLWPHPAPKPSPETPLKVVIRDLPADAAPVIGCTGFFLPGKGISQLITGAAELRRTWPGLRVRLVNADYGDPSSAAEIAVCRDVAAASGLPVEWHTDFMPLAEQSALLAGCDLLVLPYQHSKEASSAALRSALGSGIPVAVTPLPLFDEAADAVFRLSGCEPHAIGRGVGHLLGDVAQRAGLAAAANRWLANRSTPAAALRLHGMILGLAVLRQLRAPMNGGRWRSLDTPA